MYRYLIFLALLLFISDGKLIAQLLQTKFGKAGVEQLSYQGVSLIDLAKQQGSSLTAEHFRQMDNKGKILQGMSELLGATMDIKSGVYSAVFNWGSLECQYKTIKDTLKIVLKLVNTSKSNTLLGVNVFPLHLSFPQRPKSWQPYYMYFDSNIGAPTIVTAEYEKGKLSYSNDNISDPLFVGMIDKQSPSGSDYKLWVSSIPTVGMSELAPNIEKRIAPGKSVTHTVSIRFGKTSVAEFALVSDIIARYRKTFPAVIKWFDRRPIASLVLSSYENKYDKNNPRGWLPNGKVDVISAKGRAAFRTDIMMYADRSISIMKSMNAQGMITWDIEGQEFPHALSYIGSPEKMKDLAPEMESIADEYFKKFKDAGLRVGICIRPDTVLVAHGKKTINRVPGNAYNNIARKIAYARRRWGCSLFYIDSNGDPNFPMDPDIFRKINQAYPDVLLIPEHQHVRYYAYSAPYEEWKQGIEAVPTLAKAIYPEAFMVLNVADGIPANQKIATSQPKLNAIVNKGDILLFRGWFMDAVNPEVKEAYQKKVLKK